MTLIALPALYLEATITRRRASGLTSPRPPTRMSQCESRVDRAYMRPPLSGGRRKSLGRLAVTCPRDHANSPPLRRRGVVNTRAAAGASHAAARGFVGVRPQIGRHADSDHAADSNSHRGPISLAQIHSVPARGFPSTAHLNVAAHRAAACAVLLRSRQSCGAGPGAGTGMPQVCTCAIRTARVTSRAPRAAVEQARRFAWNCASLDSLLCALNAHVLHLRHVAETIIMIATPGSTVQARARSAGLPLHASIERADPRRFQYARNAQDSCGLSSATCTRSSRSGS